MTTTPTAPPAVHEAPASPDQGQGDVPGGTPPTPMKHRKKKIVSLVTLLLILAALLAWYLTQGKPLSQLPGLSVSQVPTYKFSIYGASHPFGVAATPSGDRIYVTETDGARLVRIFDHDGKPAGTLKPPASTGASHTPVYVAVNPVTNDVYVSDRLTFSVYVYDKSGKYLRTFAPRGDLGGGWEPLGLAFGPDGSLYATDVRGKAHRVLVFAPDGTLVRSMGLPEKLSFPNGVVVDKRGNVEITDSNNGRLLVFDPAGKPISTINRGIGEGDLGMPRGAAVDDAGRLFVVDTIDHMVRVYDLRDAKVATPKFTGSFGGEGQLDGTFQYPNGIATDTSSRVYVTDRENNRVQVWGY